MRHSSKRVDYNRLNSEGRSAVGVPTKMSSGPEDGEVENSPLRIEADDQGEFLTEHGGSVVGDSILSSSKDSTDTVDVETDVACDEVWECEQQLMQANKEKL